MHTIEQKDDGNKIRSAPIASKDESDLARKAKAERERENINIERKKQKVRK
jgi:hypothetical protein